MKFNKIQVYDYALLNIQTIKPKTVNYIHHYWEKITLLLIYQNSIFKRKINSTQIFLRYLSNNNLGI